MPRRWLPRFTLFGLTLGILCVAVSPLAVAGRPGTPDNVLTWVREGSLDKGPSLCASFHNTATVDVRFFVEWTKGGQPMTAADLKDFRCIEGYASSSSCTALSSLIKGSETRPGDAQQVFCKFPIEPDTEFCFRFRSIDHDGLWSEYWSPRSCATTPPLPELPAAPAQPAVYVMPAESGRGVAGTGTPTRVLVEWQRQASSASTAGYRVEFTKMGEERWISPEISLPPVYLNQLAPPPSFEVIVPFPTDPPSDLLRYQFRVCAFNYAGAQCSASRATEMGLKQQAKADAKLADSAVPGPGLKTQAAIGGMPRVTAAPTPPAPVDPDLDALALKGAAIAAEDPLFAQLRESQPDDAARSGFDIGAGASEGQSAWGPGKQRILDSLPPAEQVGYKAATSYALDRNRYAERARLGAAIVAGDAELESERARDTDARYALGFDIATAIFGDRAKGAQGNTATGPGSLGIRDSLSETAQRGFDAAVKLHLSRTY